MRKRYLFHNILNEDKNSDYVKKMIKTECDDYYKSMINTPVKDLDSGFQSELKEVYPSEYESSIAHDYPLWMLFRIAFLQFFYINGKSELYKYVYGFARIGIGELGMFRRDCNINELFRFRKLALFAINNSDFLGFKFDFNFDNLTFDEMNKALSGEIKRYNQKTRNELSKMKIDSGGYTVVQINSYEQASEYGKYTPWCVTYSKGNYDKYTLGGSRFYFCLKNGFEDVEEKVGMGCPLDTYGLSMVSVLIDIEGNPTVVTTRWNHEHDGENNENLRTPEQIQKTLGIDFYKTFLPYTKEERKELGIISFEDAKEMLEDGVPIKEIFDHVWDRKNGFAVVQLNYKWNFITEDRHLLSDKWYDHVGGFYNGLARVRLNNKWNFITESGHLLSDKWYDYVGDFYNGFARVRLNNKYNFIKEDGHLWLDKWYDGAYDFHNGLARVQLNNKWNFIKEDGRPLLDKWYDYVDDFVNGFATVQLGEKWNFIKEDGHLLSDKWYDGAGDFYNGFAAVELDNKYNFIKEDGHLLSDKWYDWVGDFRNGLARVELDGRCYKIDESGRIVKSF